MISLVDELRRDTESMVQSLLACVAGIVEDSRQYAIELDQAITPWYKDSLAGIGARVRHSGSVEAIGGARSEFRATTREHKLRAERYLAGLRQRLKENAEALATMAEVLTADHADHDAILTKELSKLRSVADCPDADALRRAVRDVASALDECIQLMKRRNTVAIAELTSEIRVLHAQIDGLKRSGTLFIKDGVAAEIAAGNSFTLVFVHLQNLPLIARRHGSTAAGQVAEACLSRLKALSPEDGLVGCWDKGLLALLATTGLPHPVEFMRNVGRRVSGTYVVASQDRDSRIDLMVATAAVQRSPLDSADRVASRIQDVLLSMGIGSRP